MCVFQYRRPWYILPGSDTAVKFYVALKPPICSPCTSMGIKIVECINALLRAIVLAFAERGFNKVPARSDSSSRGHIAIIFRTFRLAKYLRSLNFVLISGGSNDFSFSRRTFICAPRINVSSRTKNRRINSLARRFNYVSPFFKY